MMRATPFLGLVVCLAGCTVERIVYVEVETEEQVESRVSANIVRSKVTHRDGIPFLEASGRVWNNGPNPVKNVRVWVGSNHGDLKIARSSPSSLAVEGVGTWSVTNLEGTYVQYKNVTFEEAR